MEGMDGRKNSFYTGMEVREHGQRILRSKEEVLTSVI